MKKIMILAALSVCGLAAAQNPDTLHVKSVNDVMVITSENEQTVILKGTVLDQDFSYRSSVQITPESSVSVSENHFDLFNNEIIRKIGKRTEDRITKKFDIRPFEFRTMDYAGFGMAFAHNVADDVDFSSHLYSDLFMNMFTMELCPGCGPVSLTMGMDLGVRSFRTGDGMFSVQDRNVVFGPIPEGTDLKKSVLRAGQFSAPVLLHIYFDRDHRISVYGGAELNFNFAGHVKNKFHTDAGKTRKNVYGSFVEPWTWNYMAGIKFRSLSIFCRYSPCNFLKEGRGPSFQTCSFGILW